MRFEFAQKLLRPMAEGLALFAQYDVEPHPKTKIISRPMSWAYNLFTRPEEDESARKLFRPLLAALRRMRLTDASVKSKANLFLEPLKASAGGYLPGYLTVKGLWRLARRVTPRFDDPDLFYTFLQRYIYRDYGLVALLLQERVVGQPAAMALVEYLENRIASFGYLDLEAEADRLDRMEEIIIHDPEGGISPAINTDPALVEEGKRLLREASEQLSPGEDDPPEIRIAKVASSMTLAQRELMCIGRATVQVEPAEPGFIRVKLDGETLLEMPAVKKWKPRPERGMLTLYLSLSALYKVVAVTVKSKLIAIGLPLNIEETLKQTVVTIAAEHGVETRRLGESDALRMREQIENYVLDQAMADEMDGLSNQVREDFIDAIGFRKAYLVGLEAVSRSAERIYKIPALGWADKDTVEACYSKMAESGLREVLKGNTKLLRAASRLSLAASVGLSEEEVTEHFRLPDMTVREALEALAKCGKEAGFPLVYSFDGVLDSFV